MLRKERDRERGKEQHPSVVEMDSELALLDAVGRLWFKYLFTPLEVS